MPSPWVEHVRKYAKDNNISYMCAISDASKTYDKKKPMKKKSEPVKKKVVKIHDNLNYNKHITPKLQNKEYKTMSAERAANTRKENENLKKNKLDFARLILKNTDKENKILLKDINTQLKNLFDEEQKERKKGHVIGLGGHSDGIIYNIEKQRELLIYKRKALTGE